MSNTRHALSEYVELLADEGLLAAPVAVGGLLAQEVELVACDSQRVVANTLFICKGAHFREGYLADAAARGAIAYVSELEYPAVDLPCILVSDVRRAQAHLATFFYGDPWKQVKV